MTTTISRHVLLLSTQVKHALPTSTRTGKVFGHFWVIIGWYQWHHKILLIPFWHTSYMLLTLIRHASSGLLTPEDMPWGGGGGRGMMVIDTVKQSKTPSVSITELLTSVRHLNPFNPLPCSIGTIRPTLFWKYMCSRKKSFFFNLLLQVILKKSFHSRFIWFFRPTSKIMGPLLWGHILC